CITCRGLKGCTRSVIASGSLLRPDYPSALMAVIAHHCFHSQQEPAEMPTPRARSMRTPAFAPSSYSRPDRLGFISIGGRKKLEWQPLHPKTKRCKPRIAVAVSTTRWLAPPALHTTPTASIGSNRTLPHVSV